jgi:hypothetical protein
MNDNRRPLTDAQYRAVEDARKTRLAELIRRSGLSYSHIADATGTERRAVRRAADCDGIRFDTAVRLEYFLEYYIRNNQK